MKTTFMQSKETVNRTWYVIDAKDIPLGRVASKAATILRGKHKVTYTPHVDCGDYVIIVNADKVALTGNKLDGKIYYDHSRSKVLECLFEPKYCPKINISAISII